MCGKTLKSLMMATGAIVFAAIALFGAWSLGWDAGRASGLELCSPVDVEK